jgi:3-hydroxyisobutyrate dehydrogenase
MGDAARVGFVGIGNMGAPMVRCLLKAGHTVTIFDASTTATAPFSEVAGVKIAQSLPLLAAACPVIVTMLPDSRVVRRVVLGGRNAPGLSDGLGHGKIIVDMSSSYAPDTMKLGEDLTRRGVGLVDAPVSGGVGKAVTGTLAIMVGGRDGDVDRVAPMLSAMGTVHRAGPLGAGHALKALNNYVSAAGLLATCEALAIGEAFGLDPKVMTKIINASTGRNNTTENKAERYLIPRAFNSGFSLALMTKDVGMAEELGMHLGIAAEELEFVSQYLKRAARKLGSDADHTAVMALYDSPEED